MRASGLHYGFGRHTEFLPPSDIKNYIIVSKGAFVTIEAGCSSDVSTDPVRLLPPTDYYYDID